MNGIMVLFGGERYVQYGRCLTDDPYMIFLYGLFDATLCVSLIVIAVVLTLRWRLGNPKSILYRRSMLPLYAALIFLYGLQQFTGILILFWPIYRLDVVVTAITASVSVVTAYMTTSDLLRSIHEMQKNNEIV